MVSDERVRFEYLGNTPSSDVPICSIIIFSTIFHSLFYYFLPSSLTSLIKTSIISTFHAVICVLSVVNFFVHYSVNLNQINRIAGGGVYGTGDEVMAYSICYSLGYFVYDLLQMVFDKSTRIKTGMIHHIIVMILFVLGIMNGIGHTCQFYLLAEELSTIPLHLKTIYHNRPRLYEIFSYLFAFSFILSRLIYGSIICAYGFRAAPQVYRLASSEDDTKSIIIVLLQFALCILTRLLNFYWTILILRKYFHLKQSKEKTS